MNTRHRRTHTGTEHKLGPKARQEWAGRRRPDDPPGPQSSEGRARRFPPNSTGAHSPALVGASGYLRSSHTPCALHKCVASRPQRRQLARAQRRTVGKSCKQHSLAPWFAALFSVHNRPLFGYNQQVKVGITGCALLRNTGLARSYVCAAKSFWR